jgi:hypothetical protein
MGEARFFPKGEYRISKGSASFLTTAEFSRGQSVFQEAPVYFPKKNQPVFLGGHTVLERAIQFFKGSGSFLGRAKTFPGASPFSKWHQLLFQGNNIFS